MDTFVCTFRDWVENMERTAPWQYNWKRPTVDRIVREDSPANGETIDFSAAEVEPEEVSFCSGVKHACMLAATLYSTSGSVGDLVALELIQDNRTLLQRCLRWPGSAFSQRNGLLALTLCRKPSKPAAEDSLDAAEVLAKMSLGLADEELTHSNVENDNPGPADSCSDLSVVDPPSQLVLVCVATDGKVHFYTPLDLLNEQMQRQDSLEDVISVSLTTLMLGDLHPKLNNSVLPLSSPSASVQLSIHIDLETMHHAAKRQLRIEDRETKEGGGLSELFPFYALDEDGEDGSPKRPLLPLPPFLRSVTKLNKEKSARKVAKNETSDSVVGGTSDNAGPQVPLPPFLLHFARLSKEKGRKKERQKAAQKELSSSEEGDGEAVVEQQTTNVVAANAKEEARTAPNETDATERANFPGAKLLEKLKPELEKLKPDLAKDERVIDLWDNSRWDPAVEPSSIIFRTLRNVPRKVVPMFGFVAVIGNGSRLRVKKPRSDVSGTGSLRDADSCRSEAANSLSVAEQDGGEESREYGCESADVAETIVEEKVESEAEEPTTELGGFVVLVSVYHASETRTIYLPFVPEDIHPVVWRQMSFAVIFGRDGHQQYAVAIRLDSARTKHIQEGGAGSVGTEDGGGSRIEDVQVLSKGPNLETKRFKPIPIVIPNDESSPAKRLRSLSFMSSSAPAIVMLHGHKDEDSTLRVGAFLASMCSIDKIHSESFAIHPRYRGLGTQTAIITELQPGKTASFAMPSKEVDFYKAVGETGQGWTFVGLGSKTYFVCWEGASSTHGSYVKEIDSIPLTNNRLLSNVVPKNPRDTPAREVVGLLEGPGDGGDNSSGPSLASTPAPEWLVEPRHDGNELDQVLEKALASLSSMDQEVFASDGARVEAATSTKSTRLLQQCDSWKMLEETRASFGRNGRSIRQFHRAKRDRNLTHATEVALIWQCEDQRQTLSLRQDAHGPAAPFDNVLAWLSQRADYFTAANVALCLLGDFETAKELRRIFAEEHSDDDLDGLLDGVVPLYPRNQEQQTQTKPEASVVTHLADMAIGCLIRGGHKMSRPLISFLRRNENYDPTRMSVVLVATASQCISDQNEIVDGSAKADPFELLWALRALMEVGVSRNHLSPSLVLLNGVLGEELRNKGTSRSASLSLSKAMMSIILSASANASPILLELTDEKWEQRFWKSLSDETKFHYVLIEVKHGTPLLREPEVRSWLIGLLQSAARTPSMQRDANATLSISFLKQLCLACLKNGGCDVTQVLAGQPVESSVEDASKYLNDVRTAQDALVAAQDTGRLDFEILISSLLLLSYHQEPWHPESSLATQTMLDAACHLAGRCTAVAPSFQFDAPAVMKQCAALRNVSAGANLVGGEDGLLLKCCDILMQASDLGMEDAEAFLLNTSLMVVTEKGATFQLTEGHKQVLLLLNEHVVRLRTFGQFHSDQIRGKVDPIFAARTCLRAWMRLSNSPQATAWLVGWLRQQLGMSGSHLSRLRIACAAISRALLWAAPDDHSDDAGKVPKEALASAMGVDSSFLVQLSRSCCGLVEAIPKNRAEMLTMPPQLPVEQM